MDLFRLSGPCTRRVYAELLLVAVFVGALLIMASRSGWLPLPQDRCFLLSLEYLPMVLQWGLPLVALGWAVVATSIRRCRHVHFPAYALALAVTFYLLAVLSKSVSAPPQSAFYLLGGLVWLASGLLGLILAGLLLFEDFSLEHPNRFRYAASVTRARTDALFGGVKAARLMADWHRRERRPNTRNGE